MKIFLKECKLLIKLWQKETVYIEINTICFAMKYMYHEWLIKKILYICFYQIENNQVLGQLSH